MFQLLYEKNVSVFPTGLSVRGPVCWVSFGDLGLFLVVLFLGQRAAALSQGFVVVACFWG